MTNITTAVDGRFARTNNQTALRPQIAWHVHPLFAVWAGPTLNVLTTDYDAGELDLPVTAVRLSDAAADTQVWLWPGFAAGVRVF